MIEAILPEGVAVAECFADIADAHLFPEEEEVVRAAGAARRSEYATVRHCARQAMAQLGLPPAAVLSGENREPQWPPGIVGTMTHSDGYRAAALAHNSGFASLGIDAEPHTPLPDRVLAIIAHPEELRRLADLQARHPEVCWDRLTFSAKESVYKAWYPLARSWLGFHDALLDFDPASRTFTAHLRRPNPLPCAGAPLARLSGAWCISGDLVATTAVVAHSPQ